MAEKIRNILINTVHRDKRNIATCCFGPMAGRILELEIRYEGIIPEAEAWSQKGRWCGLYRGCFEEIESFVMHAILYDLASWTQGLQAGGTMSSLLSRLMKKYAWRNIGKLQQEGEVFVNLQRFYVNVYFSKERAPKFSDSLIYRW